MAALAAAPRFGYFAEAPGRRGMWIDFPEHPERGTSAWTYDGKAGSISQPRAYIPNDTPLWRCPEKSRAR